jgi:ribose 5-phosphate isomerase B
MKIAVGSDGRLPIVDSLIRSLEKRGHQVVWYGPKSLEDGFLPYPNIAKQVTEDVVSGSADEAIIFCYTGTGITIAANKTKGIRAALCHDAFTAKGARLWNDANVLTLSMRLTPEVLLEEILDAWFENKYNKNEDEEVDIAIQQLYDLED